MQRIAQILIHRHQPQRRGREILGALSGGDDRDAVREREGIAFPHTLWITFAHSATARAWSPRGSARGHARIGDGDAGIGVPLLRDGEQGARELGFATDGIEAVGAHPPHAGGTGHRRDLWAGGEQRGAGRQHGVADGVLVPRAYVEIGAAGAGFGEEHAGADTGAAGGEGNRAEFGVDEEGAGGVVPVLWAVGYGGWGRWAFGLGFWVLGGGWWVKRGGGRGRVWGGGRSWGRRHGGGRDGASSRGYAGRFRGHCAPAAGTGGRC